jgi:hypothetical protein
MNRAAATLLRLTALAAAALATACVQVEVDLPDICKTVQITYNGSATSALVAGSTEQTAEFLSSDLSDYLTELQLSSGTVAVSPAGAITDLKILLRPPTGSTAFDLTLLHLAPVGSGGAIPAAQADLLPYVGGQVVFQATGTLSAGAVFDATICASAKATKQLTLSP